MADWERYLWLSLLAPLLWLQGRYVRRVTPRLPEPVGARDGTLGQGPALRILIAGDSAAAGVGAATQEQALCGQLTKILSRHCTVEWQLSAVNGLDTPGLLKLLQDLPASHFDAVVLSIGVNDVTRLRSPRQWLQWQNQLAGVVQARFGPQLIVHSAVPPMHGFTALPQPLRWFMGCWAREMNRLLAAALSGQTRRALYGPFQGDVSAHFLASDGFHPGPPGYANWAHGLSQLITTSRTRRD